MRTRYVVAADGAKSPMRERLGIGTRGHGKFSDSITIYFRADVHALIGDRNLSVIYVFHPRLTGFFRFSLAGDAGFLVVNSTVGEEGVRSTSPGEDTSEQRCIEYVRRALGDPDIEVEIENVQRWSSMADWAERLREGRVFFAGDAAHVMPPTGGFGGNAGVHDADNLAWKLAVVLRGEAGAGLLATYDAERRPVAEFTVEQAYTRYVLRLDPGLGKDDLMPIVDEAAVELGYRYHSDAVVPEAGEDGALWESPHEPTARPGSRAPHSRSGARTAPASTLDLVRRGFVLLAGPDGQEWCRGAGGAADLGIPIESRPMTDAPGFAELYGTGAAGAVLLRPDGFIAWRAGRLPRRVTRACAVRWRRSSTCHIGRRSEVRGRRLGLGGREAVERRQQVRALLVGASVPRPVEDDETCCRPRAAELPGGVERAREIQAAVDQHPGDAAEGRRVAQDGALLEPRAVREVVRADANEREHRVVGTVAVAAGRRAGVERQDGVLPRAPVPCRAVAHERIGVLHQPRVRGDEVAVAFGLGNSRAKALPLSREEARDPAVQPVDLRAPRRGDREEHDLGDSLRVLLGVRQRERRAPRPAGDEPAFDGEMLAQALHVRDQMVRGVAAHVRRRVARVRSASPASALVEQHCAVAIGVEAATHVGRAPRAGAAVHHHGRLAVRVAARLPVDEVAVAHVEQSAVIGLDGRIELRHGGQ